MGILVRERASFLPWDDDVEHTLIPDIVVGEVAYVRTGLRDSRGRMILRRVGLPIGFTADHSGRPQYATDTEDHGTEAPALDPEVLGREAAGT